MPSPRLPLTIDRDDRRPLTQQIYDGLWTAIRDGQLGEGTRLPSWRDLASQLGVARGTVRAAYDRLADEQLIIPQGAAGSRVAHGAAAGAMAGPPLPAATHPLAQFIHAFDAAPMPFQMGVPAQDVFPAAMWARLTTRHARMAAALPLGYPDPRGYPPLRREIAAYLAMARGISCSADQVIITAGFAGALGLAVRLTARTGDRAWVEDPGFPVTRLALECAGVRVVPRPVDDQGMMVGDGDQVRLAVVTPGQQAPLGITMTLARRRSLLAWAVRNDAWVIEDDYLGELQLSGRAAPALASVDSHGRVLHAGTFSKTISPALRLGFLVVPPALMDRAGLTCACLSPAPAPPLQHAVAEFLAQGQYLRHLRRMRRIYAQRRQALAACLATCGRPTTAAGLALRLDLPAHMDDLAVAAGALAAGLAPVPLSPWYVEHENPPRGLLLGVTNSQPERMADECRRLMDVIRRLPPCNPTVKARA